MPRGDATAPLLLRRWPLLKRSRTNDGQSLLARRRLPQRLEAVERWLKKIARHRRAKVENVAGAAVASS
ncbi:unnamed protein product [Ectocarpus sp. 13 AM-2016]